MPVTVVVGGQFGSEGKGKVSAYFANDMQAKYVIRCGGSNSGHTVIDTHGHVYIFRHLPTAAILPEVKLIIPAGSYIDPQVLLKEINDTNLDPSRLLISPNAVVITDACKKEEQTSGLIKDISSTGSGTGAAVMNRIARRGTVTLAKDDFFLESYVSCDIPDILTDSLARKERIVVEGTQGFGLSVLHSSYYPYVTSRDTTAAGFISESGISPLDVDDIILVIRAFPIRVGGASGNLPKEITWDTLMREGKFNRHITEYTSVTKKLRRVARFDPKLVMEAIKYNHPTRIVLNHVDYVRSNIVAQKNVLRDYLKTTEESIQRHIDYIGVSPKTLLKLPF